MKQSFIKNKRFAWAEIVKNEIARISARLFVENGYNKTTMEAIANAIGMSKANLYNYVSSKNDLIFIILEYQVKQVDTVFESVRSMGDNAPVTGKLRKFIREYIEVVDKCQNETIALHHAVVRLNKEGRYKFLSSASWMFDFVESLLSEGVKSGEFRTHDTKMFSVNIVEMCTDWARLRWYFRKLFTLEEYISKQTEFIENQLLLHNK